MDEKSIQRLSREECIEKLKEIGQHGPGTLEEMKIKLRKFSLYPRLYSARIRENKDQNNSECKHFTCQQHFHELAHDQPL